VNLRTETDLQSLGFVGFVTFQEITTTPANVPDNQGLYSVVRLAECTPQFLTQSAAGWFKGKDPTVSPELLARNWVNGSQILYFGKAGRGIRSKRGLRRRLLEYARFGQGEPIGHWGGRYIWQLADHQQFRVCWLISGEPPGVQEDNFLRAFKGEHGKLPFANLRH
jgi:hypothetical protein